MTATRTPSSAELKLRALVATATGLDEKEITPDAIFDADLGLDSMDMVELVMDVEAAFGIQIDDAAADSREFFSQLVALVESLVAGRQTE